MSALIPPPSARGAATPHAMMGPMIVPDRLVRSASLTSRTPLARTPIHPGMMVATQFRPKARQDMLSQTAPAGILPRNLSAPLPQLLHLHGQVPLCTRPASHHPAAPASNHLAAFPSVTPQCPLEIDELYCDDPTFDPCLEPARGQLLSKMRLPASARIETFRGGIGSCNSGMWVLRDGCQSYVLKLVRNGAGVGPRHLSQADKFAKLCRDFPNISSDTSLAFPCKIFSIMSSAGKSHDLVVMRHVPGQRVSDVIMQKLHSRQDQDLMRILEQFGGFLADFHSRYHGMQHGDLTPANVFYDQASGRFTLVDVADLSPQNPVIQSDAERFTSSLKLLSHFYGTAFYAEGKARFEAAYNANRCRRRPGM